IIFAGNDTTRNTLSGTMRLLTQFPDEKQKLIDNPDLMPNMVHEAIRMVSPVMYMRRTLTKDVEMSGQKIAAGEKVVMYYGAANRDPDIFENPDQFQVERENANKHIAFGLGPHVCLGQRIAMMQLDTAYRKILERFPNARWTGKQTMAPNNFVHAISNLEVDLGTGK
ncbi:MAG: cytochrome P450, partial [Parvibaculaceae bacterium]|nr:cytochrome P450 [Parvibaculaceae bacterium]